MKIKNMKLMLLGLLAMGASNASATVGDIIKRANLEFKVNAEPAGKPAEVTFMGMVASPAKTDADGAIANQPDGTITIPATTWTMDTKGNKTIYNVTKIDAGWATYNSATLASSLKKLVTEVVEKDGDGKVISNLKATGFTKLAEVVLPAGQTVLADDAFSGCTALATINLANIAKYGANALKGTIITSIDLTNAKEIGASAFEGINTVKTLTIPATIEAASMGADAFKDMYKAAWVGVGEGKDADGDPIDVFHPAQGLEEVTFNANSDATKGFATIPAVFAGDALLKKVTIASTKATGFAAGAFAGAVALEELDLTACTALTDINAGDFAAAPFKSIKLAGTKLKTIANLELTKANRSLATISLPTTFGKGITALAAFGAANKFENFIALTELDLSATQVKEIPAGLFAWSKVDKSSTTPYTEDLQPSGLSYNPKRYISPALATVKLNAETFAIGANAFKNCVALATVENLNQAKMATIGAEAFNGTALATVDLSATSVTVINEKAFANIPATSITLSAGTTEIYPAAFANDGAVTSINLQDLKKLSVLNPIFHEGVVNGSTYSSWGYLVPSTTEEVAIPISSLTLPEDGALARINPGALQLLDITEIEIPATVLSIEAYALQGCINLEKFTWNDAPQSTIANNTFRGDDHMKEVKIVTKKNGAGLTISPTTSDPIDLIFKGNSKSVLTFTVNAEDYAILVANGWTEANLQFCTLTTEGASEFEFKAASKTGDFYYATYYNKGQATWFPADKFEVFSAVVEGSDVVLKPASTEGGYYKVAKCKSNKDKNGICIIRSKEQKASYELKNADFNDLSTMPTDNELQYAVGNKTPSRLKYQYKFGVKSGVVAFYRVTSGTIKDGGVFIEAATAADRLNIVLDGEATGIQSIATEAENNAPIYNLNGVRVQKAGKGVYIQNGKKYVK